jgi:hypothetical protein
LIDNVGAITVAYADQIFGGKITSPSPPTGCGIEPGRFLQSIPPATRYHCDIGVDRSAAGRQWIC